MCLQTSLILEDWGYKVGLVTSQTWSYGAPIKVKTHVTDLYTRPLIGVIHPFVRVGFHLVNFTDFGRLACFLGVINTCPGTLLQNTTLWDFFHTKTLDPMW